MLRAASFLVGFLLFALGAKAELGPIGSGTGFFVNAAGWLVTNHHVVKGCSRLDVQGHGEAIGIATDENHDLALIKVSTSRSVRPLRLRDTSPRLGEEVIAIGYPLYPNLSPDPKVTTGNINSLSPLSGVAHILQHSAPIQPGNSGGPLLDLAGNVVGVNAARYVSTDLAPEVQNVNFAVKQQFVSRFLEAQGVSFETDSSQIRQGSVADVAEPAAAASVLIICYGEASDLEPGSGPQVPSPRPDTGATANWYLAVYPKLDFWGADLIAKGIESPTVGECASACAEESQCKVFTYNLSQKRCFLKKRVDLTVLSEGALSGVFLPSANGGGAPESRPVIAEFEMKEKASYSFLSNPFFQPRVRSLDACLRQCRESSGCNFITFTFGNSAPCRSWSAIPGRIVRNSKAVSFDKIAEPIYPAEIFPLHQ